MTRTLFLLSASIASIYLARAQSNPPQPLPHPPTTASAGNAPTYVYEQKTMATGRSYLIAPEQAQSIINRFKDEYQKQGHPRFLIYVNRELIDQNSGMKLSSHKQVIETTRTVDPGSGSANLSTNPLPHTERSSSTNIYRLQDPKEPSLADKQTMRDIERLFGRPLRMAGVHLADQRVATQLMGGRYFDNFAVLPDNEQGHKERQALTNIADVVLEILVSSKEASVAELSGDRTYPTPDLQATAIRLKDARVLGQATAADLIGQGASAAQAVRNFGIREIAEATALSLMEDMLMSGEPPK